MVSGMQGGLVVRDSQNRRDWVLSGTCAIAMIAVVAALGSQQFKYWSELTEAPAVATAQSLLLPLPPAHLTRSLEKTVAKPSDAETALNGVETPQTLAQGNSAAAQPGPTVAAVVPAGPARPAPTVRIAGQYDMLLDSFDLAQMDASGGEIRVRKNVYRADDRLGAIEIVVDDAARIFVDMDSVRQLVPGLARGAAGEATGMVQLDQLRGTGVDLRYDPVRDRFQLVAA